LPAITLNRRAFSLFIAGMQSQSGLQGFWKFGTGGPNFLATNGTLDAGSIRLPQSRSVIEYVAGPSNVRKGINEMSTLGGALAAGTETGGVLGLHAVGYRYNGAADAFIGYQSAVSDADRAAIKAALAFAYDIEIAAAPRMLFVGDSITVGTADSRSYGFARRSVDLLSKNVQMYFDAGGGNQIQNLVTNYAGSRARALLTEFAPQERIAFLHMGTNDLTLSGRTAAQIYADVQSICNSLRADGAKVVASTILATASWNGTQQTTRNTLNQSIRDNWASFADGLCDFAADPVMGPQAAASNATLFPDGLHPSSLGHQNMAVLAAASINALLNP
jgi:lysophospholipase L1-like esterase